MTFLARIQARQILLGLFLGTVTAVQASTEIWFVRHAESEINVQKGPLPTPDEGVSYPLTAEGVRQAAELMRTFVGVPVSTLYSSTRLRTLQTADAISLATGVPLRLAPAAVEIDFGPAPDLHKDVPDIVEQWMRGKPEARLRGEGESLNTVRARFLPFWKELVARHGDDSEGVVVLVTHGGIISFVLPQLCEQLTLEKALQRFIRNAQVVKTRWQEGELTCYEWNGESLL